MYQKVNAYEFSKAILKRTIEGEDDAAIEFDIFNEDFYNLWINWEESDELSNSNYELELYYNATKNIQIDVDTLTDENKSSILFKFYEEDLSDVLAEAKYALFFKDGDEDNVTSLDLKNIYEVAVEDDAVATYALDLNEKIDGGNYLVQIYIPGYSDIYIDANFNPSFTLTQELYDNEGGAYIETKSDYRQYHADGNVYIPREYRANNGDIYSIEKVTVNDKEIAKNESGGFDFKMPEADTTVKLYGTLETRRLDLHPKGGYSEFNGAPVKTLTIFGNIDLNNKFYAEGTLIFVDIDDGSEQSFKMSEFSRDSIIISDFGDGYSDFMYYLNDEKFNYLDGTYAVILFMEGYTRDDNATATFGIVHELTVKFYIDDVFFGKQDYLLAEGSVEHLIMTENGLFNMLSDQYTLDKIVVSKDEYSNNIKTDKSTLTDNGEKLDRIEYLYQMGADDVNVSIYLKSFKTKNISGGVDEGVHDTILAGIKNGNVKIRGNGQEITQGIIDSLNEINIYVINSNEEDIEESDVFKTKVVSVVGNGKDQYVSYVDINFDVTNGTDFLNVYELDNPIEVKIILDDETYNAVKDKDNIRVVRQHFDENGEVSYDVLADADVKLEGRVLIIISNKFSTFAIVGYNNPPAPAPVVEENTNTVYRKPVVNTSAK